MNEIKLDQKSKKIIFLSLAVVIVLAIFYGMKNPDIFQGFSGGKKITLEQAKSKSVDFIKNVLVPEGTEVEIVDAYLENDLYRLDLKINGEEEVTAYLTKNGEKFFPNAPLDIAEAEKSASEGKQQEEEQYGEIPKNEKPKVDLYLMSFCPFGNKAEDTMKPVYDLLKNKVDFNFHYIVSSQGDKINSLKGEPEVIQNKREACVMKNYNKDKWFEFVGYVNTNCGADGSCWEAGARKNGIDVAKINSCVTSEGVALMKEDEVISSQAEASGSPTMIINGVKTRSVYQYGNSEGYKQAVCGAFSEAPSECDKILGGDTETAEGGSC